MAEFDYSEAISEARAKYESISKALDVDRLTAEAKDLEVKAAEPGLWDDPENAQKVTSKLSAVQSQLKRLASADQRIEDVETLVELGQEEEDADIDADYIVDEKAKTATLTARGITKAEEFFHVDNLADPSNGTLSHHINQAIKDLTDDGTVDALMAKYNIK